MAGSHTNITQQMRTHDKLNLANMVFEHSSEAILVTTSEGKIEAVNPAFCLLTGYEMDEVMGRSYLLLNSIKNEKALIHAIQDSLKKNNCWAGEVWLPAIR